MTLTLSEKEKKTLAALVNDRIDEHLSRFPYFRYPVEPLKEWKQLFADPKSVPVQALKQALGWHFGGWKRKDLAHAHRTTIIHVVKAWPDFGEGASFEPEQALSFWQERLPDWQSGFDAAAFLLHLTQPDDVELVDRHRLQAMTDLLKEINHPVGDRQLSLSSQDLNRYNEFFRAILSKFSKESDSRIRLTRFIKMYGMRHAYKNVRKDYAVHEPEIRSFSWNDCAAERFDLSKITWRSNADVLFACLLLSLDKHPDDLEALSVGKVVERLPIGTAGICNAASFNYAMISLFGNQKNRQYFRIIDNDSLAESFTKQANQSTRDMQFYKKWADVKICINPMYIV
ncbi:hypothetical protein L1N85_16125 [Paenibacillus alkaliterrae]|uniref:hypothetical protein n=1 Tax=Paenibacillus alkaliterrae TaxID=320909 RepID=UPI001F382995|nr:hypothetical protein [Paenibacillus alkaliterrae]MCF2939945.1 hypothetical protein [Paenibacillus alkaliterrae]